MSTELIATEKEALLERIAQMRLLNNSLTCAAIAKETGLAWRQVKRLLDSEDYKLTFRALADKAGGEALAAVRAGLVDMVPLFLDTLREGLKEHSVKAGELYLRALNGNKDDQNNQQTNIQVVIPDLTQKGQI